MILTAIATVFVVALCFLMLFTLVDGDTFTDEEGTRGKPPGSGTARTRNRRERRERRGIGKLETRRRALQRHVSIFGACLTLSACFNSAGQFDGAATLKASKAAAHLICAAVGALDALPDTTPLLIDRNGGVRVESSGGAQ